MRRQGQSMRQPAAKLPHKLGANQKEAAIKPQKRDANFKQSRDIREDRGERQIKTGSAPRTIRGQ